MDGQTYLVTDDLDKASAVAAVAKVKNRNKNDAKKQARAQTFYDVNQLSNNKGCMYNKAREVVYDMSSFLQHAVDRYKSLVPQEFRDRKKVSTPFAEDKIARPTSVESEPLGKLAPIASKVLMKLLFAARMARYDLLRAVQGLASRVTKWSPDCDKALHRLMCYVQSTLDMKMTGYIGDTISECKLWLFADSDHAGEHDSKSTSGSLLCLVGPNTYFPLAAFSKKQTSIALSSTEAEVVCANVSLRALGLPASAIWGILQQAGGDKAQSQTDINHQKKTNSANKILKLPKHPDEWLNTVKHEGHSSLVDGRIVELYSNGKDIKTHLDRETHPLRDVWVVRKGKWHHYQEAVAWEELANRTYVADQADEAIMLVYRRSGSEYRRHAKAEADLHMEILGIRDSGGYHFERRDPIAMPDDYGLIVAAPHSIQPVVLEDNQATIRILESGKSPAFRHADKTQRINLGWISEQFRRKHYVLAYVNTSLQAADILTKPFTSNEKWAKALKLLSIRRDSQPSRKASAASSRRANATVQRPEAQVKRVIVEVCCSEDSLLGQIADKEYQDCKVIRITEKEDLNDPSTRKHIVSLCKEHRRLGHPILIWTSLPCTGGTSWSHVNLSFDGDREKVYEARKKFNKLWASFVDLSDSLTTCRPNYAVEWPRSCVYWSWHRVHKWMEKHQLIKTNFDGCRYGLKDSHGIPVKKPWTVAANCDTVRREFDGKKCRNNHEHAKCLKESESYSKAIVRAVHKAFKNNCQRLQGEQDHSRVVPAATATRTRAHFAIPTFQHSIMAASASSSQVLTLAERQSRVAAFKAAMSDPDRRADAQAGLTEPAWIQDVLSAVVEPTREDDHLGLFLGFIPNLEWLVLREGNPNATWPELVEMWYGEFGVKFDPHRGDTPSRIIGDLNLAGWAAVMADLIRDVAVLACGTYKAPHALDITKRYDICNRVVQLKDGLGGLPVFPELARVLGDFFTPAFERMAPPTEVRGHFVIVGDSSLALCEHQSRRATYKTTFEAPLSQAVQIDPRIASTHVRMLWGKGLHEIANVIEELVTEGPEIKYPDGLDIIVSWAGNDVYGPYGYLGYTWHLSQSAGLTFQQIKDRVHWPAKQKARVQRSLDRIIAAAQLDCVNSIAFVGGPENSLMFMLLKSYDEAMSEHFTTIAAAGLNVIDPMPLLAEVDKLDDYHMAYTEQNLNVCSNWYRALCSGILTDRLIKIRKCEFAENSRARIFQKHFRGATAQPNIPLPPISGLIRPDWGEQLRLERGEDEEIVLNEPLLANPSEGQDDPMPLLPNIMEEVTEVEHAMFAPAAAVLTKEEEELQATIGVSLIQELDQEIPDAVAERIENEGEVQKFAVPDPTAGESPAEELVATSLVRQPPFFNIPQSSDDGEAEEEEEQIIFQTAAPKTKAMPKASTTTTTDAPAPVIDLTLPISSRAREPAVEPATTSESLGRSQYAFTTVHEAPTEGYSWIMGHELPAVDRDFRRLNASKMETLNRKMTYLLRGWSMRTASGPHLEFDAADLSVSWTGFLAQLEKIWNRLRTTDVIDTLASMQKTRFQVFVALKDGKYFITRIRAIQGHSSDILTDDQDWVAIHSDIYHLSSNWDPSPMTRPPVGFDGHLSAAFADFPKIAYHATKRKNIASVILNGLCPGGLTTDGSPVKAYVMFSVEPNWMRTDNEGIRENAEIEVVIDLQLAALEGVRLLRTASGCIQTPDWISNRYITFIYDRRSNEPVWHNRAYGLYRQRLAAALQSTTEAFSIMSERDSELISRHGSGCLLDAYEAEARSDFVNWLELAGGGRNPYLLRFVDESDHGLVVNIAGQNTTVDLPDEVYEATTEFDQCIADGMYRDGLYVFPNRNQVHIPNRQRLHPELWTVQINLVFPTRVCRMCRAKHHDGFIHCMGCGARFEPHTDFSGLTQGSRERDVAA